ncbi:MAG: tryptophan-rich sensory protein [Flavobacteriaceae bacterium]|nr:tryptophan-rich sensory protein [Flavobacteriaceae bacterium]
MRNTILRIFLFLFINFVLVFYIGNILMADGSNSDWYIDLNKAPWTPPGWVFGLAWSFLLICFSIYLALLSQKKVSNKLVVIILVQYLLNISWNYFFFNQHLIELGLIDLSILTITVLYIFCSNLKTMRWKSIFIIPYFLWLLVATSLNLYIVIYN